MAKSTPMRYAEQNDPIFTGRFRISSKKTNDGSDSKMAKIISHEWLKEDDPIFTGRVTISSKKSKIAPKEIQEKDENELTITKPSFTQDED